MKTHGLSKADREFRSGFEACTVTPSQFTHEAHVRLAYVYLVEHDVEIAVEKMREGLLRFLDHHGIPGSKFHETITRAWVLAVRHFMNRSSSRSSAEFIGKNRDLLDSKIMLTHYSATVLFSPDARAAFVEPDLDPIPRHATAADTSQAVDAFMVTLEHPRKADVETLRKLILGAHLSIKEGIKWKAPSFRTTEYFATVNLRAKAGIGVILHLGAKVRALPAGGVSIDDPKNLLTWLAKDRATIEFASAEDLNRKMAACRAIVRKWIHHV